MVHKKVSSIERFPLIRGVVPAEDYFIICHSLSSLMWAPDNYLREKSIG